MRTIDFHKINPANDTITITVEDGVGPGGANHLYVMTGLNTGSNPSDPFEGKYGSPAEHATILFQQGPINVCGVNGVTQEVLLAIVIDRLRSFQQGPYSCRENALALTKCEEALHWLQQRTLDRMRRGVEGTTQA
jgi:hypothetical protein